VQRRRFGRTGLEVPVLTFGGGWVGGLLIWATQQVREGRALGRRQPWTTGAQPCAGADPAQPHHRRHRPRPRQAQPEPGEVVGSSGIADIMASPARSSPPSSSALARHGTSTRHWPPPSSARCRPRPWTSSTSSAGPTPRSAA